MTPDIQTIDTLTQIEIQGLADLARFAEGLGLAQDWGLIDRKGKADLSQCRTVLAAAEQRGIVPRDPVVFPLDLISLTMTNADGSVPVRPLKIDRTKVEVDFILLRPGESEVSHYNYELHYQGVRVAVAKCCPSGIEMQFGNGQVWRFSLQEAFEKFVKRMGA